MQFLKKTYESYLWIVLILLIGIMSPTYCEFYMCELFGTKYILYSEFSVEFEYAKVVKWIKNFKIDNFHHHRKLRFSGLFYSDANRSTTTSKPVHHTAFFLENKTFPNLWNLLISLLTNHNIFFFMYFAILHFFWHNQKPGKIVKIKKPFFWTDDWSNPITIINVS